MKIGCISLVFVNRFIVAIQCSKDRGLILPGGKMEPGETYKECARRELLEETGLIARKQKLIFQAPSGADSFYVMAFLTQIDNYNPISSDEGTVRLVTWEDLLKSKFKSYYELLRDLT